MKIEDNSKTAIVWQNNYAEAKAFYEQNKRFPNPKENRRIRQWANVWYRKYAEDNPEKLQLLLDIGFQIPDRWMLWNKNYEIACDFLKKNGRPMKYADNNKVFRYFRVWVGNSGKYHPDRIDLLKKIGFDVKITDTAWDKNFEKAKVFFEEHGHFPTKQENLMLYIWAKRYWQKMDKKNPTQLNMLLSIGFKP